MRSSGVILYEGPSLFDGAPIVAIATLRTANRKTGDMIQTWIMRTDIAPDAAVRSGADSTVCGDCPLRGPSPTPGRARACYVDVIRAPLAVWRAYRRGRYPHAHDLTAIGAARAVRIGAYGDPAAVPFAVWSALTARATTVTGYTHAWRTCSPDYAALLMASCETHADRALARILGYRTFRAGAESPAPHELECLSDSAGITCAACGLCAGQRRSGKRDIFITPHGGGARLLTATPIHAPTQP